jgi:hypothetical protein
MPAFIQRLALATGQIVTVGQKWLPEDKEPVGLIVDRPETAEQFSGDDGIEVVETVPALYEIWLLPKDLGKAIFDFYGHAHALLSGRVANLPMKAALDTEAQKTKNVIRRRVLCAFSPVLFSEEVVGMGEALELIQNFFSDKIGLEEDSDDKSQVTSNGPASAIAG